MSENQLRPTHDAVTLIADKLLGLLDFVSYVAIQTQGGEFPDGLTEEQALIRLRLTILDVMMLKMIMSTNSTLHSQMILLEQLTNNLKKELVINDRIREQDGVE